MKKVDQLAQLERLRSLKSAKKLAAIESEEAELRTQIETLNEHRRQSRSIDTGLMPMRAIAADVLWQGWIDRTQMDVNFELAKLRARKEMVKRVVARDIGRREAASQAAQDTREADAKKRSKAALDAHVDTAAIRSSIARQSGTSV